MPGFLRWRLHAPTCTLDLDVTPLVPMRFADCPASTWTPASRLVRSRPNTDDLIEARTVAMELQVWGCPGREFAMTHLRAASAGTTNPGNIDRRRAGKGMAGDQSRDSRFGRVFKAPLRGVLGAFAPSPHRHDSDIIDRRAPSVENDTDAYAATSPG